MKDTISILWILIPLGILVCIVLFLIHKCADDPKVCFNCGRLMQSRSTETFGIHVVPPAVQWICLSCGLSFWESG